MIGPSTAAPALEALPFARRTSQVEVPLGAGRGPPIVEECAVPDVGVGLGNTGIFWSEEVDEASYRTWPKGRKGLSVHGDIVNQRCRRRKWLDECLSLKHT